VNKSLATNLIALALVGGGLLSSSPARELLLSTGLFALSGAVTNWLAVHMLFERVPGLYGSGIIPARFEDFKHGIHDLIMVQFFTPDNVERFFSEESAAGHEVFSLDEVIENTDLSPAFDALLEAVRESKFGGMLGMFGGESALEGLRTPFSERLKRGLRGITHTDTFQQLLRERLSRRIGSAEILDHVDAIVTRRLDELTPGMVKEIVQGMIRKHLGWLVVWGGVFGGLIGFAVALLGV
jgi:hypothetical protein